MPQKPSSPAPNKAPNNEPLSVFLSYAHKDEEWKEELEAHLSALTRQGAITLWQDRVIAPGTEWDAEIKAQLEAAQIILLLVSPRFMASDYINDQELMRALERHEASTTRVIPIILKPVYFQGTPLAKLQALPKNAEPITRWEDQDEAFLDVVEGICKVLDSLTANLGVLSAAGEDAQSEPLGYLSPNVPRLPPKFLPRPEEMEGLKAKVLGDTSQPVAVTAGSRRGVSIQGMGGIGKSVLAATVARNPSVRQEFPDGVFWLSLGQEPQLLRLQTELAKELGEQAPAFSEVADGKRWLREKLAGQTCLVVLDDIWQEAHLTAFDVCGEQGQLLITTRDGGLVTGIGAVEHSLDVLSEAQARNLLAGWTGCDVAELPNAADEIARECGYLPLALAMTGAMLKKSRRWDGVLQRLQRADLEKIKQQFPDYAYPDLLKMLQVSVDALEPEIQERYLDFAVFEEDARIPEAVLETFWKQAGLDELDTADVIDALISKSLLLRDEQGNLFLHDLQYDYITKQVEDLPRLHQRLLNAYSLCCEGNWAKGPDDGYFFGQLARHFSGAGQLDELKTLLVDYDWLQARLMVTGINGLLSDYRWHPTDDMIGLVQATLQLSTHVLAPHPEQLTERLWGHLRDDSTPIIQSLLEKAATKKNNTWLQPQKTNLIIPGGPLLRTLLGHSNRVNSVAISTDGKRALSGAGDNTLKWWDLDSGKQLCSLEGHSSHVYSVAISSSGKRALSGADDHTLKLWDLDTGKELLSLEGHSSCVNSVTISTDDKRALSGSGDHTLKLWDLDTGKELFSIEGHSSRVYSVAISTDGKRALSGSGDNTLKSWNLDTGEELLSIERYSSSVTSVAISADGKRALSGSWDSTLKQWDLDTGKELLSLEGHNDWVTSVAISADGKRALSGADDNTLKLWDLDTGKELLSLEGHSSSVNSVAISIDGKRALSGADDNTLKLWNLNTGRELHSLEGHSSIVNSVAISANGKRALSGAGDNTLKWWDLKTRKELRSLEGHNSRIYSVAISADGKRALSGSGDNTLKWWDLDTGKELCSLEGHSSWVTSVAISADAKRALSGSWENTLKWWDLDTGKELCSLKGHSSSVNSVAIRADGKRALSGSDDNTLKWWNLRTGKELLSLEGHSNIVTSVAISTNGKRALSGAGDNTLKWWNLRTGKELLSLEGHSSIVTSVAISTNGKRALSGADDNTLKWWDLDSAECLATFAGDHSFYCCATGADGRSIVAGDAAGTIHFFSLVGNTL